MDIAKLKQMIAEAEKRGATDTSKVFVCRFECINIALPTGEILFNNLEHGINIGHDNTIIVWE